MKIKICAVLTAAPPCLMCGTYQHRLVQSVLELVSEENTGLGMAVVRKKRGFSPLNVTRNFSLTKDHSSSS